MTGFSTDTKNDYLIGLMATFSAFILWGVGPIYFKQVGATPAVEILAHRILWSIPFLILLAKAKRLSLTPIWSTKTFLILCCTSFLISFNWGLFVYSISSNQIVEMALGYYINPLVSVALGAIFLGERFSRLKTISVALAALGVGWLIYMHGTIPLIALGVAFSFGFYGLIRKTVHVHPLKGLLIETIILSPLCIFYLSYLWQTGQLMLFSIDSTPRINLFILLSGVITAIPLWLFTEGAKRLELSTVGIIQYVAPSLQLGLGVLLYNEPFTHDQAIAFLFIWSALAIFTFDLIRKSRQKKIVLEEI